MGGVKIYGFKKLITINKIQRNKIVFGDTDTSKKISIDPAKYDNSIVKVGFNADGELASQAVYAITAVKDVAQSWSQGFPDSPVSIEDKPYQCIGEWYKNSQWRQFLYVCSKEMFYTDAATPYVAPDPVEDIVDYYEVNGGVWQYQGHMNSGIFDQMSGYQLSNYDIKYQNDKDTVYLASTESAPDPSESSELEIVRMSGAIQTSDVFWEMVEYSGVKLKQTGTIAAGAYPAGGVTLDTPVDPEKSMLVYSFTNSSGATATIADITLNGELTTLVDNKATKIEFDPVANKTIYWQLLEFE